MCKNDKQIYFNTEDCAKLLQTSLQLQIAPVTVQQLNNLLDNEIFHATKTLGGPVSFHNINDQSSARVAVVSQPVLDILTSIFVSTASIFHHYEILTTALFPLPTCPLINFNIPVEFLSV